MKVKYVVGGFVLLVVLHGYGGSNVVQGAAELSSSGISGFLYGLVVTLSLLLGVPAAIGIGVLWVRSARRSAGSTTVIAPTQTFGLSARRYAPFLGAIGVLVLAYVGYKMAPSEWGLSNYGIPAVLGVIGLALAAGFGFTSLSWKRWGVWLGLGLVLFAGGMVLWQVSGITGADVTQAAEALKNKATESVPSPDAALPQAGPSGAQVGEFVRELPSVVSSWFEGPLPAPIKAIVYVSATLLFLIAGQWGSKGLDGELLWLYVLVATIAYITIVVSPVFATNPWAKMGWYVVALVANRYRPLSGFVLFLAVYVLFNLALH